MHGWIDVRMNAGMDGWLDTQRDIFYGGYVDSCIGGWVD